MIEFKLITGHDGYELTKDIRDEYLGTGKTDEFDQEAIHIVGFEKGKIICAGRMYSLNTTTNVIDNVIVDEDNRLQYIGDTILRAFEDKAVQQMKTYIEVTPTESSKAFFSAEGYTGDGKMKKNLTIIRGCRGCGGAKK